MWRTLALIRRLPPQAVAKRAFGLISRKISAALRRRADLARPTYGRDLPPGPLQPLLDALPQGIGDQAWVAPLADLYRRHHFDLLGSGWLPVAHGLSCSGVEGHRFPPGPAVQADRDGLWLKGRVNDANLADSRRIWRLVDDGYRPIDWHLDFKSGYRWREDQWSEQVPFGHLPGIDIKVPWELARLQHLPVLAWSHVTGGGAGDAREIRNQILDFIAANPPRFGVNWRCAMDVAIRAANLALTRDLLRLGGFVFDETFETELKRSLIDHGRFIVTHLEWHPEGRGNHYFADVAGLLFIAAALPRNAESDAWLAFAAQEVLAETGFQFDADGANFEASTCYHRLSAEMAVFCGALLVGLSPDKRAALAEADPARLRTRPRRPLTPGRHLPDAAFFARLEGMADFTRAVTKATGRVAQIGDNDSGRFFKLHPILAWPTAAEARALYANLDGYDALADDAAFPDEDLLDHRPLAAAVAALVARPGLAAFAGPGWLDEGVARALAHGAVHPAAGQAFGAAQVPGLLPGDDGAEQALEIRISGGGLREGLELYGYPAFGLWVFRSRRLFLAVRCGPLGQNGRGGHDHNDQLAVEMAVDGEDWVADPGSYLYTASRSWRNAYRSVAAHAAPRRGEAEPASLSLGDFWLGNEARARCEIFTGQGFCGSHVGFGQSVRRIVELHDDHILIRDQGLGAALRRTVADAAGLRAAAGQSVTFSPGYGKRLREAKP